MKTRTALTYLKTNQLGSTSLAVDESGIKTAEMRYKPCPLHYALTASSVDTRTYLVHPISQM